MFKLNMDALRKTANFEAGVPANVLTLLIPANAANFSNASAVGPEKLAGLAAVSRVSTLAGYGDSKNDPAQVAGLAAEPLDPDRWCWPHSSAMNTVEIDTMLERTDRFNRRGLTALDAELLADRLVTRDRDELDTRKVCLECAHLSGRAGAMRCTQWQRAGLGQPGVPAGMELVLQRCDGFEKTIGGVP